MKHCFEMTSVDMINSLSFVKNGSCIQVTLILKVGKLVFLMRWIYEVRCLDGFVCRDIHNTFYEDQYRLKQYWGLAPDSFRSCNVCPSKGRYL
jgi:hypothetical protein